jgi:hypothetical protein
MASTTDPEKPNTGPDSEGLTDTGGTDRYAMQEQHGIVTGDFDREINVRGILWTGFWLAVVTIVANLLMWWFLRGFQVYDQHHEVKLLPMAAQNPQQPPQGPLLQPEDPRLDRYRDMIDMHENEDQTLTHATWVDHPGGTLRVPIDVAIDAIAQRGVAPFPATGVPPTAVPGAQSSGAAQNPAPAAPVNKPPAQ